MCVFDGECAWNGGGGGRWSWLHAPSARLLFVSILSSTLRSSSELIVTFLWRAENELAVSRHVDRRPISGKCGNRAPGSVRLSPPSFPSRRQRSSDKLHVSNDPFGKVRAFLSHWNGNIFVIVWYKFPSVITPQPRRHLQPPSPVHNFLSTVTFKQANVLGYMRVTKGISMRFDLYRARLWKGC